MYKYIVWNSVECLEKYVRTDEKAIHTPVCHSYQTKL